MTDIRNKIIEYIQRNRVSTTEIADCLDKTGAIPNVYPVTSGHHRVGKIKWVYAYNSSNWDVHEQIRDVNKGDIVFIETFDIEDRAIIGELVSKFVILYRGAAAIVTNAKVRDAHKLKKERYPVWCSGFTPVGCYNTKNLNPFDNSIIADRKSSIDGAVMVCDDTGVVIIPKELLTDDFYRKIEMIEEQEDIWFDCIDRRKFDTFETVCLRKYEN